METVETADTSQIQVREPSTPEEMEAYYDLRWRILREPWSRERGQERDEHESGATHLAAWMGDRIVGVGRVHFLEPGQAQVRYMAVETALQGRGIGGRILAGLEARARAGGAKLIVLNARDRAVQFYQRHGYAIVQKSEVLFDAIPHWEMQKAVR